MAAGMPPPVLDIEGSFADVAVARNVLFLAVSDGAFGEPDIHVLCIGGAGGTSRIGESVGSENALGIGLKGDYLYLAEGDSGLEIVDVSEPARPRAAVLKTLDGYSHKVTLWGDLALVASGTGGLHILDIRRPLHPVLLSSFQPCRHIRPCKAP